MFSSSTKGVVVSIYSSGPACEVEVWDDKNYPVDVVTYGLDEVKRCGDYGTKGIE